MEELKKLELHDLHVENSAKFTSFAGWEMPVSYGRSIEEHLHTRRKTSLFDVSHMGEIEVSGPDAEAFLDYALTNSVSSAEPGRAVYSPLCDDDGGTIDDLIAYKKSPASFLLCVNASNIESDFIHLSEVASQFDCEISNLSSSFGQLAVQGPSAFAALEASTGQDFSTLAKMAFREVELMGGYCLLARTGYTGEDGFEIYCPPDLLSNWAESFRPACLSGEVCWAGLAARDSLRLEAGFPLYGHELSRDISPLQAGLGWAVKFTKDDFVGKRSLYEEKEGGLPGRVVFYEVDGRRIPRQGDRVLKEGTEVGRVLSGGYSPMVEKPIGSAWIKGSIASGGGSGSFCAEVRGKPIGLSLTAPVLRRMKAKP